MYSIAPSALPSIAVMLDDLSYFRPTMPQRIAKHLGVSVATLKNYAKNDAAPKAVQLALFWETQWGRSALGVDLFNEARQSRSALSCLQDHQARLTGIIWRLEQELTLSRGSGWRAANLPIFAVG